ncbi:hypothetical protein B0H12DRAFT_380590 [Mycena haematopus]|nr:hypothetical protein B0H12DRAFT_380590 [Mycena haematopus]
MPHGAFRWVRNCPKFTVVAFALVACTTIFGLLIQVTVFYLQELMAAQIKLRSLITENTPISGFYGPGSWWAWLITLGMTHAHMVVSSLASDEPSEEWDYDLIGASTYTVAAAIDLILKAKLIHQLGNSACGSPLLPALFCAERTVWVGTGSSLFLILFTLFAATIGVSPDRRRVGVAIIPVVFAIVASWFRFRTHQTILRTDPKTPCRLPDGSMLEPGVSSVLLDVPGFVVDVLTKIPGFSYWLALGAIVPVLAIVAAKVDPWCARPFIVVIGVTAWVPLLIFGAASVVLLPFFLVWSIFWVPFYILAFFPQMGSFPLTNMSVMDMDQLAASIGIGFIAAFRSARRIFKIVHDRAHSRSADCTYDIHERQPLLDLSQSAASD